MNPIDLARLRDFSENTGEGLREFVALFLTHMAELVKTLGAAVAAKDAAAIRSEAHRGTGTAGACGAKALAALFLELEALGAAQRVEEAAALMPQVDEELSRVRHYLDLTLDQAPAHDRPAAGAQP